ncbi:MAG: DUF5362 family protein [Gammaproteobacteria bacterium]
MDQTGTALADDIVRPLSRTRPWMKFAAIIGFIFSGFALIGGLFMLFGLSFMPSQSAAYPMPHGIFTFLSLVYFLMASLYFIPSLILFRYAASLDRIERDGSGEKLAQALEHQRKFWKYVGICLIVVICLFVLSFIGMMVFSVVMAAHQMH